MKPKRCLYKKHEVRGEVMYVVTVFNARGKRQRRHFKDSGQAQSFAEMQEVLRRNQGTAAFSLSDAQRVEAAECIERLGSVSLREATDFYLTNAKPREGARLLNEVIVEHLKRLSDVGRNSHYIYAQKVALSVFARGFPKRHVHDVGTKEIEDWLAEQEWEPQNHNNYVRDISMMFRFAVKQGYIVKSPLEAIPRRRVPRNVEIYTAEEAGQLLATAAKHPELEITHFVAIALFAGVRICELEKINWTAIDLEENCIRLSEEVTKGGRNGAEPRNVDILPALATWLTPLPDTKGYFAPRGLRERRAKLLKLAGVPTKKNGFRHSFASHYLVRSNSAEATMLQLGQQTSSVLFRHYRKQVSRRECEKYFALDRSAVMISPNADNLKPLLP